MIVQCIDNNPNNSMIPQLELHGKYRVIEATIRYPFLKIRTEQGDFRYMSSRFVRVYTATEISDMEKEQQQRKKKVRDGIQEKIRSKALKKEKNRPRIQDIR